VEKSASRRDKRVLSLGIIKKRSDFLAAQSGERAPTPSFVLTRAIRPNPDGVTQVGFTVTRKIGGAVVRNRIKRRLRAAARAVFPDSAAPGFNYVLIARPLAATRNYASLLDDMKRGLLRLNALPK